jgi:hypothetical protein
MKATNYPNTPLAKLIPSLVACVVIASLSATLSASATANQVKLKGKTPAQVEQALTALLNSRDANIQLASYAGKQPSSSINNLVARQVPAEIIDHSQKSIAELVLAGLAITNAVKDELSSPVALSEPTPPPRDYAVADIVSVEELNTATNDDVNSIIESAKPIHSDTQETVFAEVNVAGEVLAAEDDLLIEAVLVEAVLDEVVLVEAVLNDAEADVDVYEESAGLITYTSEFRPIEENVHSSSQSSAQVSSDITEPSENAIPALPAPTVKELNKEIEVAEIEIVEFKIAETEIAEIEVAEFEIAETEVVQTEIAEIEITETDVVKTEIAEIEIAETKIAEIEVAEFEIAETEVVQTEIAEIEIAETEVVKTEITEIEIAETEVVQTEIAEIEIAETEVVKTEITEIEIAETEVVQTEIAEIEIVETEVVQTEIAEIEIAETEVVQTEIAEIEIAETEVTEIEVAEFEIAETEVTPTEILGGQAQTLLAKVSAAYTATSQGIDTNTHMTTSETSKAADNVSANLNVSARSEACPENFNQVSIPANGKMCQIFAADFPASMILFIPQTPEEVVQYYLASSSSFVEPKKIKQRTMLKSADNNTTLIISKDGGGTQVDILVKSPVS